MALSENDLPHDLSGVDADDPHLIAVAYERALDRLNVDPHDAMGVGCVATAELKRANYGLAYHLFDQMTRLCPDDPRGWNGAGHCLAEMHDVDGARLRFEHALSIRPNYAWALNNLATLAVRDADWDAALALSRRAFDASGRTMQDALYNAAMAYFAREDWEKAWSCYVQTVGCQYRPERFHQPWWDGSAGTVAVYGEQGLGDEIMYASMVPDAARDATVHLECTPRLEGLFRRSFPGVHVHGTRGQDAPWADGCAYRVPAGNLGALYRQTTDAFPGAPWLKADPVRRAAARGALDSLGPGPKIGIAWSGGLPSTGEADRSLPEEALAPLLARPAHWVSVQYKNPPTDPRIHHWPQWVQAADYDETAALLAELDLVVSVTNTTAICAGALGVRTLVMAPEKIGWIWRNGFPWAGSVEVHRGEWETAIADVGREVDGLLSAPATVL